MFANIPINVYTVLKTFTMHVEDVSMEIACKSAVYEYVYQILLHYKISVRQQAL